MNGLAAGKPCGICLTSGWAGAEEAAEKPRLGRQFHSRLGAGAEARLLLSSIYGTTEVVPCYKALPRGALQQPAKPFRSFGFVSGPTEVGPFQNSVLIGSFRSM